MRLLHYIITGIIAAMTLTACSGNEGKEARKATSAKATRVAIVRVDECLPLIVAEHLGLLDSLHADVRLITKGSIAECKAAVKNGDADACVNDSAIEYKMITSKKARIKRISQLSDKVIAADREGHSYNMARQAIDSLLRAKQHAFIIQVEDLQVRLKMLTTGNVDAAMMPEPYATQALKMGCVRLPLKRNGDDNGNGNGDGNDNGDGNGDVSIFNLQPSIAERLKEPLRIAEDSIKRFGKEHYERTWK